MLSESELVEGCRNGDRACQKALYDRFCKKMMVVCLRYSKSTMEAEDILQEGFVRVFQGLKGFRHAAKLETWMTRIMVNTALNHHRKKLYLYPMVDVQELDLPQQEISLSGLQFAQLIDLIQSLPQGCQVVFNLFAIEGYSHKEIAEMLGISEGTSKSQYARARMLLINKLNSEGMYKPYGEAQV
ncbi:MAG: sigma-70 family RNA polymerase sigma factor [Flammeovirgaceae bacterium]|nr:MAG: sigma-70 family RNA polymerase sigma factor [Flammeovirgaceae bacterium]